MIEHADVLKDNSFYASLYATLSDGEEDAIAEDPEWTNTNVQLT